MNKTRILFMGTPDFSVPSLKALANEFDVIGVVTQTDKPRGRGNAVIPSPVKIAANELGIPVYQPQTFKDFAFESELKTIDPDLIVVVAYGKILPEYVLNYPKLGCVNAHGSLLPAYRGAAPMQRAIMEGAEKTGITTMYMAKGLDTGDMLEKAEYVIGENDNFETVHDALAAIAANLLISTCHKLENNEIIPEKQDDSFATYAAKIEDEDCRIDFHKGTKEIHDRIRGLSPTPLAFCILNGSVLKITSAYVSEYRQDINAVPGTVYELKKNGIFVVTGDGVLAITGVLPTGKKRMSAADYINGRKIKVGDLLL